MQNISLLIKPSSARCNLACKYCFYFDEIVFSKEQHRPYMSHKCYKNIIKKAALHSSQSISICFQGGEPMLIGLDFYKKALQIESELKLSHKIYHSMQTNASLINAEWAEFFKNNNFLLGVSLDGDKASHDIFRCDKNNRSVFTQVMSGIDYLKQYKVPFNVLCVVNCDNVKRPKQVYEFMISHGFLYMQFIACIPPFNKESIGCAPLDIDYGNFLIEIFNCYYQDFLNGKFRYIQMFEEYIRMLLGFMPSVCGMNGVCTMQYVFESDGDVYPCDFYALDSYKLGNVNYDSFIDFDKQREKIGFLEDSKNFPEKCKLCKYFPLCRCSCKRYRKEEHIYCKSYKMFFEKCITKLEHMARLKANMHLYC